MTVLVVATRNPGKLAELRILLERPGLRLIDLDEAGVSGTVPETGSSYAENARFKAISYARLAGLPAVADDSGIEAAALDGAPGHLSARYGGDHLPDAERNRILREAIEASGRPERGLVFRCVMTLATPAGELVTVEGSLAGELAPEPRGTNGFGYDPIFLLPGRGVTTAELSPAEKDAISHRGQAARALAAWLEAHPEALAGWDERRQTG